MPQLPPPDRSLTITWHRPDAWTERVVGLSGLDHMLAIKRGELPVPPILRLIDIQKGDVQRGRIVFEFTPQEQHYNAIGVVHGGIACTLLDSAMGSAIHTTLPAGAMLSTLQVNINFVRAMTSKSGLMRCEGRVLHEGNRVATAEASLCDRNGKLHAHGTTTCLISR
jgi:uncharacterized protein (TIGR00369 family)